MAQTLAELAEEAREGLARVRANPHCPNRTVDDMFVDASSRSSGKIGQRREYDYAELVEMVKPFMGADINREVQ